MTSNEERYRQAAEAATPPRPKSPRPIVILGAGGIIRAAHLPAYAKAGFPVIAVADSASGKAAELASEKRIPHAFNFIEEAVRFAPADAIFDIAVPATQIMTILPQLPSGAAVLIQKPMGETLEEATRIRHHCRQRGLVAAVNFQLRYSPNNLAAVALQQAGLLGELHDIEVQVRTYTPRKLWTFLAAAPRLRGTRRRRRPMETSSSKRQLVPRCLCRQHGRAAVLRRRIGHRAAHRIRIGLRNHGSRRSSLSLKRPPSRTFASLKREFFLCPLSKK